MCLTVHQAQDHRGACRFSERATDGGDVGINEHPCHDSDLNVHSWMKRCAAILVYVDSTRTIKALTVDTGGTVLDWHRGVTAAFSRAGARHGVERDWAEIARAYRRQALRTIAGAISPDFNIDDVHRNILDLLVSEYELSLFTDDDRDEIWRSWHELKAWPDAVEGLSRMRRRAPVISFTILSTSLIVDVSRRNGIEWDCVISCEMLGVYKPLPQAYRTAAKLLGIRADEILMVATHNFDLLAARSVGFRTAFVHRPDEWGDVTPPEPVPDPTLDIVAQDFVDLAFQLDKIGWSLPSAT